MGGERTDRLVGSVLDGRFRLDDVIGSGGMGKVYAGVQLSVERRVAVKVLREELSESETLTQRFFREAKVVASLRHANVVGLVDFGRDDERGLLYIAMEYVDGVSLAHLLRRGRLEPALVVGIARQVCSALAEAHAAGVIHRDLKPDNVMLVTTAEGALSVKVLDFGIALPTGEEARLTSTGAVVGTPHYMAPEQAQDKPITAKSDIYSLGVLVYEMLTGRLPFVAETPMAVLLKVITQPPPPIQDVLAASELPPPALIQFLSRMLAKDPADRPDDIAAVANALDRISSEFHYVTPPISTPGDLEQLVVERASDEFVHAQTAASPVPTPSSGAAVPPISTMGDRSAAPPEALSPTRKRWPWLLLPLLVLGCCCLPSLFDSNRGQQPVPVMPDAGLVDASSVLMAPVPADMDQPDLTAPPAHDLGIAATAPPDSPDPPMRPAKRPAKEPSRRPPPSFPSMPEADGTVRSGSRGGTCLGGQCDWTDGPAGCRNSATCTAMCPSGGCSQLGFDKSTSVFDCDGGACRQGCYGDANCVLQCSGGGCQQVCLTNGRCELSCSGGGC